MGKIISMHRSTARVRKRATGEQGNRGEFGTVTRGEADVAVLPVAGDAETDMERQARLLADVRRRSGIDPSMVMPVDHATTALGIAEDEGISPAGTYVESFDDGTPNSAWGAPDSPQREATSELFADMVRGRCSLSPAQRGELVGEAASLAEDNDLIQRGESTWVPSTAHPGQMARLRMMQVTVGVQHARGPDGVRDLTDEFMRETDPERRARLGQVLLHEADMAEQLRASERVRDFSGGGETGDGGPMYPGSFGSNFQRTEHLHGAELTREIRQDLKAARRDGFIPQSYGVRVNQSGSSSMHQSVNVLITPPEGHVPYFRGEQTVFEEVEEAPVEKPSDSIIRQRVETLVGSYNRDTSNSQVDYFNRKFYERVDWSDPGRLEDAD